MEDGLRESRFLSHRTHSFLCSSGKIEGYDLPRGKLFGGQIGDNLREFLPTEQMLFLLNDLIINAATWLPGKNIRFFKDSIVYFPYRYVCAGCRINGLLSKLGFLGTNHIVQAMFQHQLDHRFTITSPVCPEYFKR